ncbi:T3SS (YopN, CesT) and YbjN peptide-binding chaperone 1 [Actinocorallia longicatena]|uniref:TY-Chap central domain-containing protein n=1 Tax=Actinocorallia longicatena TaxID=111803 RepID=A0ABP6Q2T8_9ACTN
MGAAVPDEPECLHAEAVAITTAWAAANGLATAPAALADLSVGSGSAIVYLRVLDEPPLIDLISPLVRDVGFDPELHEALGAITRRMLIGRVYCTDRTIWASCPVLARPFQPEHLMIALSLMTGLADDLDDELADRFGGMRAIGDEAGPHAVPDRDRIGMYL